MLAQTIATLGLLLLAAPLLSQETAHVAASPDSRLWIDGTSTIGSWSCKATTLDAVIDFAPPSALRKVTVRVPVRALRCDKPGMDNNLFRALKADGDDERTAFIVATFDALPTDLADATTLHTAGMLMVAGVENKVAMDVTTSRLADGTVRATGTVPIRMTDYGIKPPTALFGRIRTGNDIKVNFELIVGAGAIATALGQP
jgi:polyisoprenoid-binding protein YceI